MLSGANTLCLRDGIGHKEVNYVYLDCILVYYTCSNCKMSNAYDEMFEVHTYETFNNLNLNFTNHQIHS